MALKGTGESGDNFHAHNFLDPATGAASIKAFFNISLLLAHKLNFSND